MMLSLTRKQLVYRFCLILLSIVSLAQMIIGFVNLTLEGNLLKGMVGVLFAGDVVGLILSLLVAGMMKGTRLEDEAKFTTGLAVVCFIISTISAALIWSGAGVKTGKTLDAIGIVQLVRFVRAVAGFIDSFHQKVALTEIEERTPLHPISLSNTQNEQAKK
jgi:hypothetical protein